MSDLIYDIGMHDGEDSRFYLLKGFRVVAVEADPSLCRDSAERLRPFVESSQLTIVNRAISSKPGPVTFYRSSTPGWGTIIEEWHKGNEVRGATADSILVEGATLAELVQTYGAAFYMKVDIEGMDRLAIESLEATNIRPAYLSMESSVARTPRMAALRSDFDTLVRLGYDRFKIVDQDKVTGQSPPNPPRAGKFLPFRFVSGASGLFAEETPGEWLGAEAAVESFRRIYRKKWLEMLLFRRMRLYIHYSAIMHRLTGKYSNLDWYDIHAKHSSVE